jgi:hypothetical protein
MPLDTTAGNVALGQLSALPFENIIGGPLTAAIKAQAMAAQTTVDFVRAVGLQEVSGKLEAINVEFTYQDGTGTFRRVAVPILTVIPIPFIVIDAVDIEFKARIAASAQQSSEESSSEQFDASASFSAWGGARWGGASASFSASYSAKKDSKSSQESQYSVEYTMDVHVHASQSGLPQGMAQILNILQDGITNKPVESQLLIFGLPPSVTLSGTFSEEFTAMALNADGDPGKYKVTVAFAPAGILVLDGSPPTTNPGTIKLKAGSTTPTEPTDVTLTITATSTATPPGDPIVVTRAVTVLPA